MPQPAQISQEHFDKCLEIYRNSSPACFHRISDAISRIRDKTVEMPLRLALHLALIEEDIITNDICMNDGAEEYDDILAGEKIYQDIQED